MSRAVFSARSAATAADRRIHAARPATPAKPPTTPMKVRLVLSGVTLCRFHPGPDERGRRGRTPASAWVGQPASFSGRIGAMPCLSGTDPVGTLADPPKPTRCGPGSPKGTKNTPKSWRPNRRKSELVTQNTGGNDGKLKSQAKLCGRNLRLG